jgi:hypothetical protein
LHCAQGMDPEPLVLRITERMTAGTLPCVECIVTWSGPGHGRPCAVCDQPILRTDAEIECILPGGETVLFHDRCFTLWRGALPALSA